MAGFACDLDDLEAGRGSLYEIQDVDSRDAAGDGADRGPDLPPLASLVRTDAGSVGALLAGVFAATTLDAALAHRGELRSCQSIITRDGVWLGADWMRVDRTEDPVLGVVERAQELESLGARFASAEDSGWRT